MEMKVVMEVIMLKYIITFKKMVSL